MDKRLTGAILILASVFLIGFTMLTAVLYQPYSTGYFPIIGEFGTTLLVEVGGFLTIPLAGYLFVLGVRQMRNSNNT